MTDQIYDAQETGVALNALETIARVLPEPFLLIGGWGVYLTVDDSYKKKHDTHYLGSRDIDICFHVDPEQDLESLRNSTYARAIEAVKKEGYMPYGSYRFCKMVRREDGKVLTEEEARHLAFHELTYLYIDMMVDHIHPQHKQAFGCDPIDEPIAARVFEEGNIVTREFGGFVVSIPEPSSLLATKLRSIPHRQKDDKLLKDACDIYSIIWHSSDNYTTIIKKVKEKYPRECAIAHSAITDEITFRAAYHLGVDVDEFKAVIDFLKM